MANVSIRYTDRLAEAGIEPSVGSVGDSYDTLAETINGLYKAEVIHRRSWQSREAVELATLEWVDWFNHRRLLGSIGNNEQESDTTPRYPHTDAVHGIDSALLAARRSELMAESVDFCRLMANLPPLQRA